MCSSDLGIFVSDINIIDFDFSDVYVAAIEAKHGADDRDAAQPGRALQAGGGLLRQAVPRLDQRVDGGIGLGGRRGVLRRLHLAAHGPHLYLLGQKQRGDPEI